MDTALAKAVRDGDNNPRSDGAAKRILKNKIVLAKIIKHLTPEFANISVDQIASKYIESDSITDNEGVLANLNPIEGIDTEDNETNEGKVNFDILFKVNLPDQSKQIYQIYVDIEPQGVLHPNYSLTKRAIYYGARLLSRQIISLADPKEYNKLQPVCSIWICFGDDVAGKDKGSITELRIAQESIKGNLKVPDAETDLLRIHFITLDEEDNESELTGFLGLLFNPGLTAQQRIDGLEKHGIDSTIIEKEVRVMTGIYAYHEEHGRKEGHTEGIGLAASVVRVYMRTKSIEKTAAETNSTVETVKDILTQSGLLPA